MTLPIVEVGEACARQRARSMDLFEWLGRAVAGAEPPQLQRLLAEAAHRHAWHAELWAQRSPAIPPVDLAAGTAAARRPLAGEPTAERYAAELAELAAGLDALAAQVDADLDPSTARVLALVRADVAALTARLPPR